MSFNPLFEFRIVDKRWTMASKNCFMRTKNSRWIPIFQAKLKICHEKKKESRFRTEIFWFSTPVSYVIDWSREKESSSRTKIFRFFTPVPSANDLTWDKTRESFQGENFPLFHSNSFCQWLDVKQNKRVVHE